MLSMVIDLLVGQEVEGLLGYLHGDRSFRSPVNARTRIVRLQFPYVCGMRSAVLAHFDGTSLPSISAFSAERHPVWIPV